MLQLRVWCIGSRFYEEEGQVGVGVEVEEEAFIILISITLLWEFECNKLTKVGLLAGLYSGNNLPDFLYLTPHALHNVLGPNGPLLHCGVLCA